MLSPCFCLYILFVFASDTFLPLTSLIVLRVFLSHAILLPYGVYHNAVAESSEPYSSNVVTSFRKADGRSHGCVATVFLNTAYAASNILDFIRRNGRHLVMLAYTRLGSQPRRE
jgi:hypothetical protein